MLRYGIWKVKPWDPVHGATPLPPKSMLDCALDRDALPGWRCHATLILGGGGGRGPENLVFWSILTSISIFPLVKDTKMGMEPPRHTGMSRPGSQGFTFQIPYRSILELPRGQNLGYLGVLIFERFKPKVMIARPVSPRNCWFQH